MRQRLREYIRAKGITEYRFLKEAKLSLAFFTSNADGVSARTLVKIGEAFPDLNLDWVTTGNGSMTTNDDADADGYISLADHQRALRCKDDEIERLKAQLSEARARLK